MISSYRLWLWIGIKMKYFKKYNVDKETALANAKMALEEAFTPQLQSMLREKMGNKVV